MGSQVKAGSRVMNLTVCKIIHTLGMKLNVGFGYHLWECLYVIGSIIIGFKSTGFHVFSPFIALSFPLLDSTHFL